MGLDIIPGGGVINGKIAGKYMLLLVRLDIILGLEGGGGGCPRPTG